MKIILKNKVLFILLIALCIFVVGCSKENNKDDDSKNKYNKDVYGLYLEPILKKDISLEEAKTAINEATGYFSTIKSYSYDQTLYGVYDDEYTYTGKTKIDASGSTPKASIELSGTSNFAFYIANNKAYLNYDGYKTSYDVEGDLSNAIDTIGASIGTFTSFDVNSITEDNLVFAGIDEYDSTIIKFDIEDGAFAVIVIHDKKIMKVMHNNLDGVEYIADYDYNPVTVELPSDLSDYENK